MRCSNWSWSSTPWHSFHRIIGNCLVLLIIKSSVIRCDSIQRNLLIVVIAHWGYDMSRADCCIWSFLSKQHHVLFIVRRSLCINFDLKIDHMLFFRRALFSQLKKINKVLFLLWLKNWFSWWNCHLRRWQYICLRNVDDSLDSITHQNSVLCETKVNLLRGIKFFFWTWVVFFIDWQLKLF